MKLLTLLITCLSLVFALLPSVILGLISFSGRHIVYLSIISTLVAALPIIFVFVSKWMVVWGYCVAPILVSFFPLWKGDDAILVWVYFVFYMLGQGMVGIPFMVYFRNMIQKDKKQTE